MPKPNQPVIVRHPEAVGVMVVLDPGTEYDAKDPVVAAYPQYFQPIVNDGRIIESVAIEQTTAEPGEKRARSKAAKKAE